MCDTCGCNITPGNEHLVKANGKHARSADGRAAVTVLQNLLSENDHQAAHNREHFDRHGVLALNLMSSPGSGKTSLLETTIAALGNELRIAVASMLPVEVTDSVTFELVAADDLEPGTVIDLQLTYACLNTDEYGSISDVDDTPDARTAQLFQNHPNPFNPTTTIKYSLPAGSDVHVKLVVFDARGYAVRTLVNEVQQPGPQQVMWDGRDNGGRPLGSGVYLYRLNAGQHQIIRKMVLLK